MLMRTQISLSSEERELLDAEAARTGRSISALIRDAVTRTYSPGRDAESDLRAIDAAFGVKSSTDADGKASVENLRSGGRLDDILAR